MRLKILTSVLVSLGVAVASCGRESIAERVSSAEMAMGAEDVASTRMICDEIMGETAGAGSIEAVELGRLSILYMQLYDRTDDTDAMNQAVKCYRSAFEQNADSAQAFYNRLPVDQEKYAMSLATLVQSIDNPADISDDYTVEENTDNTETHNHR